MQGITPIVAIVILLLMTVSAAGMAYLTITSYQQEAQSGTHSQIESISTQTGAQLKIESVSDGQIYLRNLGSESYYNPSFYVEGKPLNVSGPQDCAVGDVCVYTVMEEINCTGDCELSMGADAPVGTSLTIEEEEISAYCGDGNCNIGENCYTCETDCGVCNYITKFSDDSTQKSLIFDSMDSQVVNITIPLNVSIVTTSIRLSGNKQWSVIENVSQTSGHASLPRVAVDSNDVIHVVWNDPTSGNSEMYYKNRTDGVWSDFVNVSNTTGSSWNVELTIDSSDNLHVFWEDATVSPSQVFYSNRTNGVWSESTNVSQNMGSNWPRADFDTSGTLHLVWGQDNEIFYENRSSSGVWSQVYNISQTSTTSNWPQPAADNSGSFHVTWQEYLSGPGEIFYKNVTNGAWSETLNITNNDYDSNNPYLVVDSSNVLHLIFTDNVTGTEALYYKNCTNGVWSDAELVPDTAGDLYVPHLSVDSSGNLHVVWRENTVGNQDTLYKNRTNGVWQDTIDIIQNSANRTYRLSRAAVDSANNVHVFGEDYLDDWEIIYKSFSSPLNPSMIVGSTGSSDWSYSDYFDTQSTTNFKTKLATILSTCSCPDCSNNGTHCTIGLNITSKTAGGIILSNLEIAYT